MTLKRLTFTDIQTSDLLYYDPDLEETCLCFCRDRNIDCLPSLSDPLKFYQSTEAGFSEAQVTPARMVKSSENIFDASLLERFRTHHLLFVYADQELTGVVHFSDYNRPVVDAYLYGLLSSYERSLRKLLALKGLKNEDMLAYFRSKLAKPKKEQDIELYQGKLKEYERRRPQNERLPTFECFYLLDLISLARNRKIIKVDPEVNYLRNMVMHANELVHMYDANRDDYIYDFASFEAFFKRVLALLQDFKKVNNRIALSEFRQDMQRKGV